MRVSSVVSIWTLVLVGCSDAHLNLPPVVQDLAIEAMEDTVATATLDATDPDRDGLLVELATESAHGEVEISSKTITYTPEPNFHGDDMLTVTVYDTKNPRETATVLITVLPVNDAPIGEPDTIATTEDTPRTIATSALLQNDSDIDVDTLTISAVANATHGTVALSGSNIVFTPTMDFAGEGSFEYTLSDGTATATVAVTVDIGGANDTPVANNDTATTAEDTPITLTTLLANDPEAHRQVLTLPPDPAGSGGSLAVPGHDGTFPPDPNFNGTASFTYVATDGVASDTATVTVTVTAVNDAPVANDNSGTTNEDTAVTFSNLVGNDTDVDLDTLTVTAVSGAVNGSVVLNAGSPIFTPAANYNGPDASFVYTESDGKGSTDAATVTIRVNAVNDSPVANNDIDTTAEDTPITFTGLVGNDTDPENDTLTVTAVTNFSNCVVSLNGGDPIFTPAANFNGTASFDYTVSDGNGGTDTGSVSVTVTPLPDVSSVTPVAVSLAANGGTAILTVTLDTAAGSGGEFVNIVSASPSNVAVPSTVTIPQGATSATFRIRADATGAIGPFNVTASLPSAGSASSAATVVATAPAPVLGDLVINELLPGPPVTGGDANCDGTRDSADDEFIEIANLAAHPVELTGVSIWDTTAFGGTTARFSFGSFVLGPGEVAVVFGGGAAISNTTDPWCVGAAGSRIGDSQVFYASSASGLSLNDGGDTIHITATTVVTSAEIVTALVVPSTSSQGYVRVPDFTGGFVKETASVGATDRLFTPGTLVTGQPFASVGP